MQSIQYKWFMGLLCCSVLWMAGCESKAKGDFIRGCTAGYVTKKMCGCVYDKLENKYSTTFMESLQSPTPQPSQMPYIEDFYKDMQRFAVQCQK